MPTTVKSLSKDVSMIKKINLINLGLSILILDDIKYNVIQNINNTYRNGLHRLLIFQLLFFEKLVSIIEIILLLF